MKKNVCLLMCLLMMLTLVGCSSTGKMEEPNKTETSKAEETTADKVEETTADKVEETTADKVEETTGDKVTDADAFIKEIDKIASRCYEIAGWVAQVDEEPFEKVKKIEDMQLKYVNMCVDTAHKEVTQEWIDDCMKIVKEDTAFLDEMQALIDSKIK